MPDPKPKRMTLTVGMISYFPGMHCLELSGMQLTRLGSWRKQRLLCTLNDAVTFSCGILPKKAGGGFIMLNKKRMKAAGCRSGDRVPVSFVLDNSRYGMPMPEELEEVLLQDPYGQKRFEALTPGKQRNIIHYISTVKSTNLRIDRSIQLIRNLCAAPEGKETMRMLLKPDA